MHMTNFLQTLIHPDQDDDPSLSEIAKAANLLQVGEFQLLQLAYLSWHGEEMPESMNDSMFRAYMLQNTVPSWARHYARKVIELHAQDDLDDRDPRYHRYDADYYKALPLGARRLAVAVSFIIFVMGGGVVVGHFAPQSVTSVLPPYFNDQELPSGKTSDLQGS